MESDIRLRVVPPPQQVGELANHRAVHGPDFCLTAVPLLNQKDQELDAEDDALNGLEGVSIRGPQQS